jgi:hypothetical protein
MNLTGEARTGNAIVERDRLSLPRRHWWPRRKHVAGEHNTGRRTHKLASAGEAVERAAQAHRAAGQRCGQSVPTAVDCLTLRAGLQRQRLQRTRAGAPPGHAAATSAPWRPRSVCVGNMVRVARCTPQLDVWRGAQSETPDVSGSVNANSAALCADSAPPAGPKGSVPPARRDAGRVDPEFEAALAPVPESMQLAGACKRCEYPSQTFQVLQFLPEVGPTPSRMQRRTCFT